MAYPGAALSAPFGPNVDFSSILPARVNLVNKETKVPLKAILKKVNVHHVNTTGERAGEQRGEGEESEKETNSILRALWNLLNYEIVEGGDSYPFDEAFTFDQFKSYYASHDLFVIVREEPLKEDNVISAVGDNAWCVGDGGLSSSPPLAAATTTTTYNFGNSVIGAVHIRPNFPARSCIVANGAFLVVPQHRRFGGAQVLGSFFPIFAKMLGYRTTLFNLVYEVNWPSVMLWRKLGYPEIGRVAVAGLMRDKRNAATTEGEGRIEGDKTKGGKGEKRIESAAYLFSINLYEEGKVIVPSSSTSLTTDSEKRNAACALELDLEQDILKNIPSGVFGKFLAPQS